MKKEDLYCFLFKEANQNDQNVVIDIDDNFTKMKDIYDYFGKIIYTNNFFDNPIYPYNHFYFGKNFNGFFDCLKSYLFIPESKPLTINILSWNNQLLNGDLFRILLILAETITNFDPQSKLKVFVSKQVLNLYYEEQYKLISLTDKPEDFLDTEGGEFY